MLTTNALSMFPTQKQLEQAFGRSVGFDTLFDRFFEVTTAQQGSGYPPYNLKEMENIILLNSLLRDYPKRIFRFMLKMEL